MSALEDEARHAEMPGVILDTGTDENYEAARALYRDLGYVDQGGIYLGDGATRIALACISLTRSRLAEAVLSRRRCRATRLILSRRGRAARGPAPSSPTATCDSTTKSGSEWWRSDRRRSAREPGLRYKRRRRRIQRVADRLFEGEEAVLHAIERIVAPFGLRVDASSPWVDARLPGLLSGADPSSWRAFRHWAVDRVSVPPEAISGAGHVHGVAVGHRVIPGNHSGNR